MTVIRAVLAVALATALVAVAVPGVEDARTNRADRLVRAEVGEVERAAGTLLAADETGPGAGARRVVEVRLPDRSWTTAGVESVEFRGSTLRRRDRSRVAYRLSGRPERVVPLDVPLYTPDGPVVVRGDGRHRVVLELVEVEGQPAILVRAGD